MKTIIIKADYDVAAERVWRLATDYGALAQVMRGLVAFEGLPEGRTKTGQKADVMVSMFGKLPAQPYKMDVIECDDAAMILRSSESGAGVKSWRHTLTVRETETGCQLVDNVEIDAGFMTPVMAAWGRIMYKARHKRRLELLRNGAY